MEEFERGRINPKELETNLKKKVESENAKNVCTSS